MRLTLHALPALLLLQVGAPAAEVAEAIRVRVEQLRAGASLQVRGVLIASTALLPALYEGRAFAPLWTDPGASAELTAALGDLEAHGLDPADYAFDALRTPPLAPVDPAAAADLDLLRSHALARAARDLRVGRVDPAALDPGWELARPRGAPDAGALQILVLGRRVRPGLAALAPAHFIYRGLLRALAELRGIARAGGWPRVPDGPALRQDSSSGPRVATLRRRLLATGDLAAGDDTGAALFDAALARAVRRFQHRHALNEDGVVGPRTLAELNVPVEVRSDIVRVNLERARWILHDLADTFVAVNVAGQRVYFVRAGEVVWETRAIVGREYTRTPIFADSMRYIVLNPTWTVPRSINGEILTALRRNPAYLRDQGFRVVDGAGRVVDAPSLDFSRWSGRSFPYWFRQEPGPANALGRIKFMFPNAHNVYLHDTPARTLFAREDRTFSHGCIRVEDPLHLAGLLLPALDRTSLEAALATGQTRTLHLDAPVPTLILYWTASVDLHGELHFYRDAYGRDGPLLRALDAR